VSRVSDAPATHAAEQLTPGQQWALIVTADHGPLKAGVMTCRPIPKDVLGLEEDIPAYIHHRYAAELMRFGLVEQLPDGYYQATDLGRRLLQEIR
jgi:hypothetical protein